MAKAVYDRAKNPIDSAANLLSGSQRTYWGWGKCRKPKHPSSAVLLTMLGWSFDILVSQGDDLEFWKRSCWKAYAFLMIQIYVNVTDPSTPSSILSMRMVPGVICCSCAQDGNTLGLEKPILTFPRCRTYARAAATRLTML